MYSVETKTRLSTSTPRWLVGSVVVAAVVVIGTWLLYTPAGIQGKADAVGYAVCHRIPERSFTAYDRQTPLCARCNGMYIGVMGNLALIIAAGRAKASRLPTVSVGAMFALFIVIFGIDGLNSYFHLFPNFDSGLYEPNNTFRVVTGTLVGTVMIQGLLPVFNAAVWKRQDPRRAVNNLRELAAYVGGALLIVAAVLTESSLIVLIIGLTGAFGVVLMLTMVNSVMFITMIGRDRTYTRWSELWLPLLAGLTMAILLIGGVDALRYMLTGTWDGFIFDKEAF